METNNKNRVAFYGQGSDLLGILLLNWLLTGLTFGIYYPWARAAKLRYIYQETEFAGSRFIFHGTGKEMFIGFLKAIGIFLILYAMLIVAVISNSIAFLIIAYIIFIVVSIALVPLAIHSAMRYRLSRSSWRGIHFGYRGNLKDLFKTYLIGSLLTLITFGIYGFWLTNTIRKKLINNVRFGNVKFHYTGTGDDLFVMYLKGVFFGVLTLGIYFFWFIRDWRNYFIRNIWIEQDGKHMQIESTLTTEAVFENTVVNIILLVFTLGLALPWVIVRNINLLINNLSLPEAFNPDIIAQTEEDYRNALGEDLADMLDLNLA